MAFENIPQELRLLRQWVCHRKGKKAPVDPKTGEAAKVNDSSTWGTFAQAVGHYKKRKKKIAGIGFVFGKDDPYVGIDIDKCRDPKTGAIDETVRILLSTLNSYTEISKSGKGLHVIIKANLPVNAGHYFIVPNRGGDSKAHIEMYDNRRFFIMTGDILKESFTSEKAEERQQQLDDLLRKLAHQNGKSNPSHTDRWNGVGEGMRNNAAISIVGSMVADNKATYSDDEIIAAVDTINRFRNNPPDPDLTLAKIQDMIDRMREKDAKKVEYEKTSPLLFPSHVISGKAGAFAHIYGEKFEAPIQYWFFAFLTCLGITFSPQVRLCRESSPNPRLYAILLGESANTRKSTVVRKTTAIFRNVFPNIFTDKWGIGSDQGLINVFKKNKQVLMALDEFKTFVGKASIQNSTLLPAVAGLFEHNRLGSTLKDSDVEIPDCHLAVLACSTPETYDNCWKSAFTDIGFNNRLWLVPGENGKKVHIPPQVSLEQKRQIRADLLEIQAWIGDGKTIQLSKQADAFYKDWYEQKKQSVHSRRLETYAERFMMLLAINELTETVDGTMMQKVLDLMNWQLAARRMYDPIDCDNEIARTENKIRRAVINGKRSLRDLKRACHTERIGLWVFNAALENLKKAEEIMWKKDEGYVPLDILV